MNVPLDVHCKLMSLIGRYMNLNEELYNKKQQIQQQQQFNFKNTRSITKRNEAAMQKKNEIFFEMCKSIRAIYLYLNKQKKYIFSFNNKSSIFWKTVCNRKKHLIRQCQLIIDNNEYTEDIRKYLGLTIKTLKKYDENYGMQIGLILNRLFFKDISWTIYEYL